MPFQLPGNLFRLLFSALFGYYRCRNAACKHSCAGTSADNYPCTFCTACKLPQRGRVESLNVAQACTVMCYEWLRREMAGEGTRGV